VAFKAEELTTQIFPGADEGAPWAVCPENTIQKGRPCGQSTYVPCPEHTQGQCPERTIPPDGGGECPENTIKTVPPRASGHDRAVAALPLLQAQLRERLAQGPVEAGL
jgi:hypothetical protein